MKTDYSSISELIKNYCFDYTMDLISYQTEEAYKIILPTNVNIDAKLYQRIYSACSNHGYKFKLSTTNWLQIVDGVKGLYLSFVITVSK